jgi:high-affinity Fe2+/Pb2+ permease
VLYLPWRIRPPTESEQNVLFWGIIVFLVGFGVVCLFFGYRAPVEKAEEAAKAIRGGWGFIAAGIGVYLVRRLFCGFSN